MKNNKKFSRLSNVISMKNDFLTIYGDQVKKTGTFRWAEEFRGNFNE